MAERRMFAKTIVLSDAFLDMPMSARCLYFTLGMLADDDGFINAPRSIMRQCGASDDDLKLLLAKKFVLAFESGVIVIKHWRMNNYLQKDRYNETKYKEEKALLFLDENNAYSMTGGEYIPALEDETTMYTQSVDTQDRLGKDSLDKDSIGKDISIKGGVFQRFAGSDKELSKALKEFNEFRNRKKKPMTDEAKDRMCKRLEKFPREQWIEILHQSIDQGWTDIYPLKEEKPAEPPKQENRNFKASSDPDKWAKDDGFMNAIGDLMNG